MTKDLDYYLNLDWTLIEGTDLDFNGNPYYYIEKNAKGFTVYGGGFGYGVGLSKNGAANLAEEGYNYKYIVHHYYAYVKFLSIYDNSVIIEESDTEEEINPED